MCLMQASQEVLEVAGGAYRGSLNHYNTGGGCMVTTLQIDEIVFVVGQDDYRIGKYSLNEWTGIDGQDEVEMIDTTSAQEAWEVLQMLRQDAYVWQCGGCDAWIFTSNRPRIGLLKCSTCGKGGVDFRWHDRQVGADEDS